MTHKRTSKPCENMSGINYAQRHYYPHPVSYRSIRMDEVKAKVCLVRGKIGTCQYPESKLFTVIKCPFLSKRGILDKSANLVFLRKQYLFNQIKASKTHLHFLEYTTEQGFTTWGLKLTLLVYPSCSKRTNSSQRKVGLDNADLLLGQKSLGGGYYL